ncbi:MFS general substrate transporter [Venturia nashicola]|uniref:MFS general substrate transporter n=1 Tax=Venturia nashicola TaxID=86259 RepID=A0A4Z1PJJ6_9PEZI|nr:MFS general substrate transporter [Venturia nashicola]
MPAHRFPLLSLAGALEATYWQVFLAQGICMALGAGLLFVRFSKPLFFQQESIGARHCDIGDSSRKAGLHISSHLIISPHRVVSAGAVRTMGFIAMGICIIAFHALLYGTSLLAKARPGRKLYDFSALKDSNFNIFTACSCFTFLGYIVPYFFLPSFCQDVLGISKTFALYILVMGIGASFFGRLAAGVIAHSIGPLLCWFSCALISGILSLCWMAVNSQGGGIAFSVVWGFFSAGLVTLPAAYLINQRLQLWLDSSYDEMLYCPFVDACKPDGNVQDRRVRCHSSDLWPVSAHLRLFETLASTSMVW